MKTSRNIVKSTVYVEGTMRINELFKPVFDWVQTGTNSIIMYFDFLPLYENDDEYTKAVEGGHYLSAAIRAINQLSLQVQYLSTDEHYASSWNDCDTLCLSHYIDYALISFVKQTYVAWKNAGAVPYEQWEEETTKSMETLLKYLYEGTYVQADFMGTDINLESDAEATFAMRWFYTFMESHHAMGTLLHWKNCFFVDDDADATPANIREFLDARAVYVDYQRKLDESERYLSARGKFMPYENFAIKKSAYIQDYEVTEARNKIKANREANASRLVEEPTNTLEVVPPPTKPIIPAYEYDQSQVVEDLPDNLPSMDSESIIPQ